MDLSAIAAALGGSRFPKGGDPLGSIAARLAEWLCGLGDISVQYKSVALFVQVGEGAEAVVCCNNCNGVVTQ